MRLSYLAACRAARDVVAGAGWTTGRRARRRLATELLLDALAPTNFLPTNPAALKRAFDTAGMSLAKGARNFADDLLQQRGPAAAGRHQRRSRSAATSPPRRPRWSTATT